MQLELCPFKTEHSKGVWSDVICQLEPEGCVTKVSTSEKQQDYVLEEQVGFLLRLASQRHAVLFNERAPYDLTPTQFSAFLRLAQQGSCSQNELGRRICIDVATIKGVVDRLKAKGMVVASPDPKDKRRTVLSVSPQFKSAGLKCEEVGAQISDATLSPLSDAESKMLIELLKKISG